MWNGCAHQHSMPLAARPVKLNGKIYLDGGISDSDTSKLDAFTGLREKRE